MQLRTQGRIAKSVAAESATDQTTMISNLYDSNVSLRTEVDKLRASLEDYDSASGQSDLTAMVRERDKLLTVNGSTPVTGPGVQLTASANLKPEDLQDLVNELRNAGAEAIAINGQRVVVKTSFYESNSTVFIDGNPVAAPYVLMAIGQSDTLEKALDRKGGLVTYLQSTYPNTTIAVAQLTNATLPAFQGTYTWQYATPTN